MNRSESLNELATALSKAQGELTDAHKEKQGYGYKYAELSSILDIGRPILSKHGLSVTQLCRVYVSGSTDTVSIETILMHSSGQWISEVLEMPIERQLNEKGKGMSKAQAAGAIMTYARRYAYAAIVGIAQTDTDAAAETEAANKNIKSAPLYSTQHRTQPKASPEQCKILTELISKPQAGHTLEDAQKYINRCLEKAGVHTIEEFKSYQIEVMIKKLSQLPSAVQGDQVLGEKQVSN